MLFYHASLCHSDEMHMSPGWKVLVFKDLKNYTLSNEWIQREGSPTDIPTQTMTTTLTVSSTIFFPFPYINTFPFFFSLTKFLFNLQEMFPLMDYWFDCFYLQEPKEMLERRWTLITFNHVGLSSRTVSLSWNGWSTLKGICSVLVCIMFIVDCLLIGSI